MHYFKLQELPKLQDPNSNTYTLHNVLVCWATTVLASEPNYSNGDKLKKRRPVWKMMLSLRSRHPIIHKDFAQGGLFPGGVLGMYKILWTTFSKRHKLLGCLVHTTINRGILQCFLKGFQIHASSFHGINK